MADRKDLPYVDAVIHEVMRIVSVVTMSIEHCAREAGAEIGGYQIPQKCHVVANLYAAMHDPDVFPEPNEFRPERFLGQDGKIKTSDNFIPFSMGRSTSLARSATWELAVVTGRLGVMHRKCGSTLQARFWQAENRLAHFQGSPNLLLWREWGWG